MSLPVVANPFEMMGTWLELNQIEVRAEKKGVMAKVVFLTDVQRFIDIYCHGLTCR